MLSLEFPRKANYIENFSEEIGQQDIDIRVYSYYDVYD